jgi:hypothetical protein
MPARFAVCRTPAAPGIAARPYGKRKPDRVKLNLLWRVRL